MTGAKHDKTFESDDDDEIKNTQRDGESDDDSDEDEEEILPDTRQTLIEPSPVFIPHQYDTNRIHMHHRRDESILNVPVGIIDSTSVIQVNNC